MAGRSKGHQKTGGRAEGTPNKLTAEKKEKLELFFKKNFPKVQANFDMLDAKDQLTFMLSILEYIMPKMARVELTGKEGSTLFEKLLIEHVSSPKEK